MLPKRKIAQAYAEGEKLAQELRDLMPKYKPPSEDDKYAPVYTVGESTFIEQKIELTTHENGEKVVIDVVSPSNSHVRAIIGRRKQYPKPPTYVVRNYIIEGALPRQGYDFLLTAAEEPGNEIGDNYAYINHCLSFKEFKTISEAEDEQGVHRKVPTRNK